MCAKRDEEKKYTSRRNKEEDEKKNNNDAKKVNGEDVTVHFVQIVCIIGLKQWQTIVLCFVTFVCFVAVSVILL